jgi:prepilin-type processing-associated H-X9-DG protein
LAELLVVTGVLALLISITVPPLQVARQQAKQTHCAANLQQLGVSLRNIWTDFDFYPLWDDNEGPIRYTWIDVLIQLQVFSNHRGGYCPSDSRPDLINEARARFFGLLYPLGEAGPGVDYSYGIAMPLSAGGWAWQPGYAPADDARRRVFREHERYPTQRVLAADACWTYMYNFSGHVFSSGAWNDPTQFDNTVAYRHPGRTANVLLQDGHVDRIAYQQRGDAPVDTARHFFWHPSEPLSVGPDDEWEGNWYPHTPPVRFGEDGSYEEGVFPRYLIPYYYTQAHSWTQIRHKGW